MTESVPFLDVHVTRRVHSGLSIDVSLRLQREIGVIFGPSGSGKTTLLRMIAGLTSPQAGHVVLEGSTLFRQELRINRPLRGRRIGMIFQNDCLFPHLNVAANIRFGLKGWPRDVAKARLSEVAALCGLEPLLNRDPETLSGGERQRVGLARALAPKPRLLLCDEPVSALDVANRHALLEGIRAVQRALDIPMLYVTHSPAEAIALGSRLFLLEAGRIVAEGPPLDVLGAARDSVPGSGLWDELRNVFAATIVGHAPEESATYLKLDLGPEIIIPLVERPIGDRALLQVRADDILLARHHIAGLSARNQIAGSVERIIRHGHDAEVVVRTGELKWLVSLVAPAIEQLALEPGANLNLIIKARSCHLIG